MDDALDNPNPAVSPRRKCRRRWFQYRLRTLFLLMTALGVWLGWESHIVRERKAALDEIMQNGGFALTVEDMREMTPAPDPNKSAKPPSPPSVAVEMFTTIPFIREWLGDEAIASITLASKASDDDVRRIAKLFPEARVSKPKYTEVIEPDVR